VRNALSDGFIRRRNAAASSGFPVLAYSRPPIMEAARFERCLTRATVVDRMIARKKPPSLPGRGQVADFRSPGRGASRPIPLASPGVTWGREKKNAAVAAEKTSTCGRTQPGVAVPQLGGDAAGGGCAEKQTTASRRWDAQQKRCAPPKRGRRLRGRPGRGTSMKSVHRSVLVRGGVSGAEVVEVLHPVGDGTVTPASGP